MHLLVSFILVLLLTTVASAGVFQRARIFLGQESTATQFPYLTLLRIYYPTVIKMCSGCLIDKEWILTAAHCIVSNSTYPERISARLGSNKRTSGGVIVNSTEYVIHNEFNNITLLNDIALVKIPSINFSAYENIEAIALPSINSTQSYLNETVVAAGWGAVGNNKSRKSELSQWSNFYVSPAEDCLQKIQMRTIPISHMCLQPLKASNLSNVCSGDSGGPLVMNSENNELIGVASYITQQGCELGLPMFYTNVTYALSWINYYVKPISEESEVQIQGI